MRLSEDIDFTTLTWVKSELDETLKQARHALEAYVEDPADASQMRFCATYLHQVQGTLRMVELYGAAMVTEEMEQLATALLEEEVRERDEAYTVLMRGIVQLPDYLERLQSGHRDIPIVLLPLLNELRSARGEKGLNESVLFTPDLGRPLPDSARGPERPMPELELRQLAEQLRKQFQVALLNWFRSIDADANVEKMAQVCDRLVSVTQQEEARRLFWVAAGVLEALRAKAFDPSPQLKQTVGKVEREIKRLADAGETSFRVDPPRELTRNLLYYVAHAPTDHGRIGELRHVFRLDSLLPSEAELEHARGAMSGHNRALLDTVSIAIKEDLMRVKDALDLHMRSQAAKPEDLSSQVDVLDRVADTLGMLGLGVARRVVQDQRDAIHQVSSGSREADESALLDIAGALLYVEASLDDQVQHLGGQAQAETAERTLPQAEARKVVDAVVKEAQANFAQAKQCFVAFVESSWDHAQLHDVPRLLEEVAGALRIMEIVEAPQYLHGIRRFTEDELLGRHRVPNGQQMDTLADALASVEYYLEALRDQRPNRDKILEVTRDSLEGLGYWPIPEPLAVEQAPPAAAAPPAPVAAERRAAADDHAGLDISADVGAPREDLTLGELSPVEIAPGEGLEDLVIGESDRTATVPPPGEQQVTGFRPAETVRTAPPQGAGFEATTDDIDEEIREVFIEEVQEEIANLETLLPAWKADPANLEALKPIRRVFHTLKGSGRLVGAMTLGEFSWRVENMLNRVLDQTIPPGPAVISVVEHACEALPGLLASLRGEVRAQLDIEQLKLVADRVSAGEDARYQAPAAAEPAPGAEAPAIVAPVGTVDEAQQVEDAAVESATAEAAAEQAAAIESAAASDQRPTVAVSSIDPVLFEILRAEIAGHLETIEAYLERCAGGPAPADDPLLRAIHTMNGAFAMTEVPTIIEVVSPLEGYVKRLLAHGITPSEHGVGLIAQSVDAVRECMLALDAHAPQLPVLERLATEVAAERDLLPELVGPSIPLHIDDDFVHGDVAAEDAADVGLGEAADERAEAAPEPTVATPEGEQEAADAQADEAAFISLDEHAHAASALGDYDFELLEYEHDAAAGRADADRSHADADFGGPSAVELPAEGHDAALEALFDSYGQDAGDAARVPADDAGDAAHAAAEEADAGATGTAPAELDALALEAGDAVSPPAGVYAEQGVEDRAAAETAAERASDELDIEGVSIDTGAFDDADTAREAAETADERFETEQIELDDGTALEFTGSSADHVPAAGASTDFELVDEDELGPFEADATLQSPAEPAAADTHGFDVAEAGEAVEAADGAHMTQAEGIDTDVPDVAEAGAETAAESDAERAQREELEALEAELAELEAAEAAAAEAAAAEAAAAETAAAETAAAEAAAAEAAAAEAAAAEAAAAEAAAAEAAAAEAAAAAAEAAAAEAAAAEAAAAEAAAAEAVETTEAAQEQPVDDDALREAADQAQAAAAESAAAELAAADAQVPVDPDLPLDTSDMDEELLDIFLEEGGDILDHSDGLLASLRQDPADRELVVGLQRDLHTLKGGARMAGLPQIGDLGHAMESLLEAVADGRRELHGSGVEVLERSFDRLHAMVTRVGERRAIAMPVELIDRVEALVHGRAVEAPGPAVPVARTGEAPVVEPAPLSEPLVEEEEEVAAISRAPQEQIRIRADLLDRLVNYAGEVAIYRARLEQQLGTFRGSLTELDATTTRLREQLRRLEIETEAQIIARYQREVEVGESSFDPLELDRFSTLQQLSRALGESAADLVNLQGTLDDQTRQYETLLLQQSRVSSELQEGLMRTRMVPFDALVPRLRRILRQTCGELGKKAQLRVDGAQGEMDRSVLDRMTAPLEHMLRNALAHGMETPEERIRVGKPEEGTVRIAVNREASEVVIRVSDDGRGIDRDAIRKKAMERGLMKPDAQLSDRDLYGFILETGFSTAETVSKIAGRGVGMDVVNSEIKQLGGSLFIESQRGQGTEFVIRLPFTLAVTQAVFVQLGDTSFAVPISSVQGVARIARGELEAQLASGAPAYEYAGEQYAIYDLGLLLGQSHVRAEDSLQVPLLLARSGDLLAAICVDQVIGSREIVVKPSGPQVSSIPGIFGATVMGDGRVVVILDVAPLVRRSAALQKIGDAPVMPAAAPEARPVPLVMVVDDSITMRKVTGRVLERHNYEVMTAKDGVDAIEKLQDRLPDVMLLDIEMPRMDGYELATHMRNDPRLRHVPIIMITSRTGEKHRQRAFEIGVDRYLGKPYQENELMRNVTEILEVGRGRAR